VQKPTLVIAHNKTLAAQLCNEFREFFPQNAVEYFVSYYDYYQPEAYVPQADLYIEKDSSRNDDIDRLRHAATSNLLQRRDTVIVASVSCIYGLGSPEEYEKRVVFLTVGEETDRDVMLRKLIDIQYVRNDTLLGRGRFRVKGDVIEIQPAYAETAYRVSMFGDEVEQITHFDPLTGEVFAKLDTITVFPATQYVTSKPTIERAQTRSGTSWSSRWPLREPGPHARGAQDPAAHGYDMEMMRELGFCNGIENYSRILDGRPARLGAAHAPRLLPVRLRRLRRRVAPDSPADRRHVRGRPLAQADAGRPRLPLPSALDNRPLSLRRVPGQGQSARLRLGDAGRIRASPLDGGLRAADPADLPRRSRGRAAPDQNQIDDLLNEIRSARRRASACS
jgi:excinuclease ABC subunit B